MKNGEKKCELLAPAGGMQQLIAAVENGADAVYLGGSMLNARMNASNFNLESIREAAEYAHIRGVKIYVTMNTLVKNDELKDAVRYAAGLQEAGVDALIIQDIGLGAAVREVLPDMELHFSTQATVYSGEGALIAGELGYSRVVPAREISLAEIESIKAMTGLEIEYFVHGALCFCYSGQCHLSRIIGGRSGNRGECAQPCRLAYELDGRKGNHLSPKDLCLIERIPELIEAGVDSFKIEGRMKSPEYVAVITSIYRKYLDEYYETGRVKVSETDIEALRQIFNRGGFTEGYVDRNPGKNLMSGDIPKHQGILIGEVRETKTRGVLVDAALSRELSNGDGVEIHGSTTTGNIITYIEKKKNGITRIGDLKGNVKKGDKIYRTSSKKQLEQARDSYGGNSLSKEIFRKKIPVSLSFFALMGEPVTLMINDSQNYLTVTDAEILPEKAISRATTEEVVKKQLGKLGNTPFSAEEITVDLQEDISVPVSAINKIRREAVRKLEEERSRLPERRICRPAEPESAAVQSSNLKPVRGIYVWNINDLLEGKIRKVAGEVACCMEDAGTDPGCYDLRIMVPLTDFAANAEQISSIVTAYPGAWAVLPYLNSITKGAVDIFLRTENRELMELLKDTGVLVNNLSHIEMFRGSGIKMYGGYGLNLCNRRTAAVLKKLGVCLCAESLEEEDERAGRLPLMITEHNIKGKKLEDRKGKKYTVAHQQDKTFLLGNSKADADVLLEPGELRCIFV